MSALVGHLGHGTVILLVQAAIALEQVQDDVGRRRAIGHAAIEEQRAGVGEPDPLIGQTNFPIPAPPTSARDWPCPAAAAPAPGAGRSRPPPDRSGPGAVPLQVRTDDVAPSLRYSTSCAGPARQGSSASTYKALDQADTAR